jgi:hypothetical protein
MNKQEITNAINFIHNTDLSVFIDKDKAEKMVDFITEILQQQLNNGWIPVSERLPEKTYKITATIKNKSNGYVFSERIRWISNEFWWSNGNKISAKFEVIAWMPDGLLEPYQEAANEQG